MSLKDKQSLFDRNQLGNLESGIIIEEFDKLLINKGFDKVAAQSTGSVLLQQAKIDGIKVFELLDTLKGLDRLQLSYTVTQVLNFNRQKISTLGYRVSDTKKPTEARNIMG